MDSKTYKLHARHAGNPETKIVTATAIVDRALAAKIIELAQMVLDQGLVTAVALSTVASWSDKDGNVLDTQVDKMVVSADTVHFETVSLDGLHCGTTGIEVMTLKSDFGLRLQASKPKLPDGDYELAEGAVWLGTPSFSVRVRDLAENGIVVDVYARGKEAEDSLGSLQVDSPEQPGIVVTEGLEWLILPDEGETTYTNWDDGRRGDASELVTKVNSDPALGVGHCDWRLPTKDELEAHFETGYAPRKGWYWSASPYEGHSDHSWAVYFDYGGSADYSDHLNHARLVRTSK